MKTVNEYIDSQLERLVGFVWQSKYEEQIQTDALIEDEDFFIHICTVGELLADEKVRNLKYEYVEVVECNLKGHEEDMLLIVLPDRLEERSTSAFISKVSEGTITTP